VYRVILHFLLSCDSLVRFLEEGPMKIFLMQKIISPYTNRRQFLWQIIFPLLVQNSNRIRSAIIWRFFFFSFSASLKLSRTPATLLPAGWNFKQFYFQFIYRYFRLVNETVNAAQAIRFYLQQKVIISLVSSSRSSTPNFSIASKRFGKVSLWWIPSEQQYARLLFCLLFSCYYAKAKKKEQNVLRFGMRP
jgi:hypothetical protein